MSFSGFNYGVYLKCFGMGTNNLHMSEVQFVAHEFNQSGILHDFDSSNGQVYAGFHYPNQYLLRIAVKFFRFDQTLNDGIVELFWITGVEILKRRNKHNEPCNKEWMVLDEVSLQRHIAGAGCRAPYLAAYKQFPVCSTKTQIKQSYYDFDNAKNNLYFPPCIGLSKIDFVHDRLASFLKDKFTLFITYPDKVKIITQSQKVDGHSVLGNIGGYIGLFLGMLHN